MQDYQYPEWRQVADVADDLDGLQEEVKWGRREKLDRMSSHQEEPPPVRAEWEVPLPSEREVAQLVSRN